MLKPVASATPSGHVRIARRYRWIPEPVLFEIELIEQEHREFVAETADRREQELLEMRVAAYYDRHGIPGRHPVTVSSRRAVIEEFGKCPKSDKIDAESRSHSRAKEPLKQARRDSVRL